MQPAASPSPSQRQKTGMMTEGHRFGVTAAWRSLFSTRRLLHQRDHVPLPPPVLRAAAPLFESDRTFRAYATRDAGLMQRFVSLKGKAVLDFGCGVGRLYFGLRDRSEPASYLGVDVKPDVVGWATRHITAANPRFVFLQSDVRNERYNPGGTLQNEAWTRILHPSFDVIYCYSVISHMTEDDARAVLDLLFRRAAADAYVFMTAFVGRQTEDILINPTDMPMAMQGPLHVVRYRRDHLARVLHRNFQIEAELTGEATDGQVFYVLRPLHDGRRNLHA
jgi:SAM-dependent methyltransferase